MSDSDPTTTAPARRPTSYLVLLVVAVLVTMLVSGPVSDALGVPRLVVSLGIALLLGIGWTVLMRPQDPPARR